MTTTSDGTLLELRDVSVQRGARTILDVGHVDLRHGETLAVLGPNGAGKSTLLRAAALLTPISTGRILLEGREADEPTLRARCAAVLQRPLLRRGSVLDNAASGLRFRGVARREARERAGPWLERLGIADLAARSARTVSGGEAQRVSIARALATEPGILLLDEPFSAVDEVSRGALVTDVLELLRGRDVATLLVTHDRREAAALADRAVVLQAGRNIGTGPLEEVLTDPELAPLIGGASILDTALADRLS